MNNISIVRYQIIKQIHLLQYFNNFYNLKTI